MDIDFACAFLTMEYVKTLVSSHDAVLNQAKSTIDGLESLSELVSSVFKNDWYSQHAFLATGNIFGFENALDSVRSKFTQITKTYWRLLLNMADSQGLFPTWRKERTNRFLQSDDLPPFTLGHITDLLGEIPFTSANYLKEATADFMYWRLTGIANKAKYHEARHNYLHLGGEVIVSTKADGALTTRYLEDLDKIFHLLDGQSLPISPDTLPRTISNAMDKGKAEEVTPYFNLRFIRSCSLRIRFLRPDLVDKFNQAATNI